jgi:hypothetical protein
MTVMIKAYVNATRNACRTGDEEHRRSEARRTVKLFLVPRDASMSDAMVPDYLVSESMIDRFLSIEPPHLRCTTDFDVIIEEIERTYVLGAFFSTLSASVVTVERVLNMARIELHKLVSPKIGELWNKEAINEWEPNIDALTTWNYLNERLARELSVVYKEIRCHYLHSGDTTNLRADSLRAVQAAYGLLNGLIGFPPRLFKVGSTIECLSPSDPLAQVFYEVSQ